MTMIEPHTLPALQPVSFDLYRDIHKGIRCELFAMVAEAGRLDPADRCGVAALAGQVRGTLRLLVEHAEHEDRGIQEVIEQYAPDLAVQVNTEHHRLEARMERLGELAERCAADGAGRAELHELYIELAAFTGSYLLHQDLEERVIAPIIEASIGLEGVLGVHGAIIGGMPPQQLIGALAVMLPAMNVDDRTELIGGMQQSAPAEVVAEVWSLAKSVLPADDTRVLAARLGLN